MKLALCQLNYTVGDLKGNTRKITETIKKLRRGGTGLAVFSEMAVCGYPPLDLLKRKGFVEDCLEHIGQIAKECKGVTVIVGSPSFIGKKLHNSAFVLEDGKIKAILPKTLLLAPGKPDLLINISASPFSIGMHELRLEDIKKTTSKYKCHVVYVNHCGANTDLVFDGGSMVMNSKGKIVCQSPFFKESILETDTSKFNNPAKQKFNSDEIALIHDALVTGIRDYFAKSGFKKAVLGLSGGIDSALVASLACTALGRENVTGLLMPSEFSSKHSVDDAVKLAKNLKIKYKVLPIKNIYKSFEGTLAESFKGTKFGVAEENIQARIRGSLLMTWANKFCCILLNTSNKSEVAVGYGTMYGDLCGSIAVLGDVYKTQVYKLAHYINRKGEIIPKNIITKPPSAELHPGQKDCDSLPEYDILDTILLKYIEENKPPEEIIAEGPCHSRNASDCGQGKIKYKGTVEKTIRMINANEFKRYQAPPAIRISSRAFGSGWKMPLVGKTE